MLKRVECLCADATWLVGKGKHLNEGIVGFCYIYTIRVHAVLEKYSVDRPVL
jgi:hypothetical protein